MADAAISFAVEKLGDALIRKINFLKGVEEQVLWVKDELQSMQCFLKDAAEKQVHDDRIRKWISDVRNVAQDAEDAIEIFTLKLDTPRRKRDLIRKWAGFPAHVSLLNRVGKKIETIRSRLQEIRERRLTYGIGNLGEAGTATESSSEMFELRRRMAPRLIKDKDVVGLNEDADLLLNKVILDEERKGLCLAVIVGMGGIGKSTLARKIYNHPTIAYRFEKRAWVVVSSEFAAEDIMKQIMHDLSLPLDDEELKALESIQGKLRRQEMLQQMLRNRLEGKCYFIVLDDVWEKTHWESLQIAFPDEQEKGSRLLFTSRNQIMTKRHGYIHQMKLLNPDESWELLLKTAFIGRRCPQELEEIGREILKKCHGLPLAITVAGGLLVNQGESKSGWDRVLKQIKNYDSETSEIGKNVSAILELSYLNLPSQLKPCFLCLGFFKEDEVIRVKRLVHTWTAQGFVRAGEESVEEIARSYLDGLIERNLVQVKGVSIDDGVKYCYVHDLLRELSIKKAKEEIGFESLVIDNEQGSSSSSSSSYKPRHRVVCGPRERLFQVGDTWNQNKHLRTLLLHVTGRINFDTMNLSYLKGFELLRILGIEGSRFEKLSPKIRGLIGLRYLRLREKRRLRLPSWLDVLKNLEILDIGDCESVVFPDVTWSMDRLRHFYMDRDGCMFTDSMKKSSWKNLVTLKYVRSDSLLQVFSGVRKLGIHVVKGKRGEMKRLLMESAVEVLHLRFDSEPYGELPIPNSMDHLTKLKLNGPLLGCPSADKFPQNITHLTLSHTRLSGGDYVMQELGKLPNLLFLKFDHVFDVMGSIKVSHEGFPRLKVLHLRRNWINNIEIEQGGMPELQRLELQNIRHIQDIESLRERLKPAELIILN